MSPSFRIPFPSIHHVLDAEPHEPILPRRPFVITVVDLDQADFKSTPTWKLPPTPHSVSSSNRDLMKTIDLRDAEPMAKGDEEQFSFMVHFPDEDEPENDNEDARTVFEEKRPATSRGFPKTLSDTTVKPHNLTMLVVTAMRKLLPMKVAGARLRRKIVQH